MKRWTLQLAAGALAAVTAGTTAQAQTAAPLDSAALNLCATQVNNLRVESNRINQKNAELDVRRKAINERSASIKIERDNVPADNLERGLAVRASLQEHVSQTVKFNAEIEQIKRDIVAVNALKQQYDSGCANRPYRRKDLAALPEVQRAAMQAGLGGVQVPYLDPATTTP